MIDLIDSSSGTLRRYLNYAVLVLFFTSCVQKETYLIPQMDSLTEAKRLSVKGDSMPLFVEINRDIRIKDYFQFIDSLAKSISKNSKLNVSEYLIVHANPWILDSLKNSDYYVLKGRGTFQYDQREHVILRRGDRLVIPSTNSIADIDNKLGSTILDVNIPEYKLRIIRSNDTILTCKVRVGKAMIKYLGVVGHDVNLQTPVGIGEIIRIERNPDYINPDDGKRYDSTARDDGRYTKMPIIPWIEPSINGIRYGDMIHATTNPGTLGKAYSHGCIGTTESDAWTIYYNSPIGTKVIFRYDLLVKDKKGNRVKLEDVYRLRGSE